MKILISIIMALFLLGCSDYGTDMTQQSEQQEEAAEMTDETPNRYEEMQEQETLEVPMSEESNDEDAADETMTGD